MDNKVTFTIEINTNGENKLHEVSVGADDLKKAVGEVTAEVKNLNAATINFAQRAQLWESFSSGIGSVRSAMAALTGYYEQQQVAETKLATNMRNTMAATEADVRAIRDLCAAQQELGVIGDEVQLAGAQELATYIEQRESLERLIPVMNDMMAQQYGVNASQESAAQIASMLGKVMAGQTAALSRYGYTFTEAQEEILKFGTESERAATLAEVVTASVGGMNAELAKTDVGKQKQLENTLGDMREQIGGIVQGMMPAVTLVAQVGQGVSGVMRMAAAVQSWNLAEKASLATRKASAVHLGVERQALALLTGAQRGTTVSTQALRAATVGLYAAYTMGLSLVVMGIAELFTRLTASADEAVGKIDDLKDATDAFRQVSMPVQSQLQIEAARLEKLKDGTAAARDKVAELNRRYGEAFGVHRTAAEWYDVLTQKSQAYARQLGYEAQAKVLASRKAEKEMQIDANVAEADRLIKSGKDAHSSEVTALRDANRTLVAEVRSLAREFDACIEKGAEAAAEMGKGIRRTAVSSEDVATDRYDGKTLIEGAENYQELTNNIRYYQSALDRMAPSETAQMERYGRELRLLEAKRAALVDVREAASAPAELTTLAEVEAAIRRQQGLRSRASQEAVAGIDAETARLREMQAAMEYAAHEGVPADAVTTYRQLEDELAFYRRMLDELPEAAWQSVQGHIDALEAVQREWDEVRAELADPVETDASKLTAIGALDAALARLEERKKTQSAAELGATQREIDLLERKRKMLGTVAAAATWQGDLESFGDLEGRDLTVRLRAVGLDEIRDRIRGLQDLLSDTKLDLGADQRTGIERQIQEWKRYERQLTLSQTSLRDAWSGVKGVGQGVEGLTDVLEGNVHGWQAVTATVDGALQIYDGIRSVVRLVELLSGVESVHTAVKEGEGVATATTAAIQTEGAATSAGAAATEAAASGLVTTAKVAEASAKTMAAHASIPWVGIAIGAGMVATLVGIMASLPKFADGGIAYGPTLGLFGEYAGAASNPEVVAPLSRLKSLIGTDAGNGGPVELRFRVKDRDLVAVLDKHYRLVRRS